MKRMKFCGVALFLTAVVASANAKEVSDQEAATNAIITSGRMSSGAVSGYTASLAKIDGSGFFLSDSGEIVKPGVHSVQVGACHLSAGCVEATVSCNTIAGHIYAANQTSCVDLGVSVAASRYFKLQDEKKAQERIAADNAKYKEYKQALLSPQSVDVLKEMNRALESKQGGFKDDPDGLLDKVKAQLQPYLEAEKKKQIEADAEKARLQAKIAQDAAIAEQKRQKEDAERKEADAKKLALFRKAVNDGDDTSCGLVIERKGKLAKIQIKTSNTEQWVKIEELYPVGQECQFTAKLPTVVSNGLGLGKQICQDVQTSYTFGYRSYTESVRITGFVENTSGNKVQLRIASMVSTSGSHSRSKGQNLDRINGDVVLTTGAVIWDDAAKWSTCSN